MADSERDLARGPWEGAGGRRYERTPGEPPRGGPRSWVLAVAAVGAPVGASIASAGTKLALRAPRDPGDAAWAREARVLQALSRDVGMPPCPRVFDQVSGGGLVQEWCPADLERWWAGAAAAPDGFRGLCLALSEVCRRLSEYRAWAGLAAAGSAESAPLALITPRTLLRRGDGRWLLSRFGLPPAAAPDLAAATQVLAGPEGFISPEALFGAEVDPPRADVWGVGCSLFALLRVRAFLRAGAPVPDVGTDGYHFRSHRANLVADLHQRKPGLFRGRSLDPRQFLYPDQLPEPDQRMVAEAAAGLLGSEAQDAQLAAQILRVLDRALQIDPARRYADPLDLAADLEGLARAYRETAGVITSEGQAAPAASGRSPAPREPSPAERPAAGRPDAAPSPSPPDLEARIAALERRLAGSPSTPGPSPQPRGRWLSALTLLLLALQVAQGAALLSLWRRPAAPSVAAAAPPPASRAGPRRLPRPDQPQRPI